jgi:ribosomal protein L29
MKYKELAQKSKEELEKMRLETELELVKERAQAATGTVSKNPGKIVVLKRTIARIKYLHGRH